MVSITFPVDDKALTEIEHFSWVNWSEVTRQRLRKREIFEEFMKTGTLSDEDQEFCDSIDWYPVDELPMREEFIRELKEREKGPFIRAKSVDEIFDSK